MDKFFRWLFGNKNQTSAKSQDTANTAPLSESQLQAIVNNQNPRFDLQQLIAACGQSVGKQGELNEDSLLALTTTMAGNAGNLPFGLYIVADGMGGHQFGEVASNAAIRTVAGYILRKFGLDPAPLVLGLVISPTLELSLRQSLVMSNGRWSIFFERPISAVLFAIAAALLAMSAVTLMRRRHDWRTRLAEAETGEPAP